MPRIAAAKSRMLVSESELETIERDFRAGLTSQQILGFFEERGVRFSEATLRKYVQLGLLPRSRRVGLKGKHRGSQGLYPASTIRRIQRVRRLMEESHTIEEARDLLARAFDLEALERDLRAFLDALEERARGSLVREIAEARKCAEALLRHVESLEQRSRPPPKRPRVEAPPAPPRPGKR